MRCHCISGGAAADRISAPRVFVSFSRGTPLVARLAAQVHKPCWADVGRYACGACLIRYVGLELAPQEVRSWLPPVVSTLLSLFSAPHTAALDRDRMNAFRKETADSEAEQL